MSTDLDLLMNQEAFRKEKPMNSVYAFTIIMLVWTISDYISKKSKSLLSSLLIASLIFLIGFKTYPWLSSLTENTIFETLGNTFSPELIPSSSLLAFGQTVVGFVILHLGTTISLAEFKQQYKTFIIGFSSVIGITILLFVIGPLLKDMNYVVSGIAALTGGAISVLIVQEHALELGLASVAALPVLIMAVQGLVGFPLSSVILKKEAQRLKKEYRAGHLKPINNADKTKDKRFHPLPGMESTAGTLFWMGAVVLLSNFLSETLTLGYLHPFVIALLFGILLSELGLFKSNVLSGIDAFGIMMLAILILVFGPLSSITVEELISLIGPILVTFLVGLAGNIIAALIAGKILKYSPAMSICIGLTALYGFPGTMILSQEAAASVGETEEEVAAIESQILPKMIIAGFSTVTITSVIITSIIVSFIS